MPQVSALRGACDDLREATDTDAVDGVPTRFVARPGSTEETDEVLRAAASDRLTVVARGAGTKLTWGVPPTSVDLVVDLSRLDAVLDHAAGDLITVVQPGGGVARLQQALASAGQRLAVDETVPGATVGGSVAAGVSGPLRMRLGTIRDLLIGVTMVRADGVVAKAGGRVVKNVAGYDLGKLVTGSFGTLGVVTETVFRLHPLPPAVRYLVAPALDPAAAGALVAGLVHSAVVPTAVEVDWTATGGSVAVLLEGISAGVQARTEAAVDLLRRAGGADVEVREQPPSWWGRYPWQPGAVGLKLTCALSGVPSVLAAASAAGVAVRGSAGTGVLYGALSGAEPAAVADVVDRLRGVCSGLGGSVVVVDAPVAVKAAVDGWGPVPAIELMRAVKDQFDPEHRLAPGRFVGGI
ncbi:FAD-binding oxidoreductase [soil metagenome]